MPAACPSSSVVRAMAPGSQSLRVLCCGVASLLVAGCFAKSAQDYERANIRPSNVIPKSSPAQFVATFRKHCLAHFGRPDAIAASLIAADYVERPRHPKGGRSFVVDDKRPLVAMSGTICGVYAQSRTGQTSKVAALIAAEFPDAIPADPALLSRDTEQLWQLPGGRAILTQRDTLTGGAATYSLVIGQL